MLRHLLPLAAMLSFAGLATAASAASLPPAPVPSAAYQSGSLHVDEFGAPEKPALILIPGLGCGPWVWNGEISHFAPNYHIYALTLPGFNGLAPLPKPPYFAPVASDVWALMASKHIQKPILIGHSLGGTLAIQLAEEHPELIRAAVAIDGLPTFPGFDQMPAAQRDAIANQIKSSIAAQSPAQFLASERSTVLPGMITSTDTIDAVAPLVAKSDPAAVAEWFREDVVIDLRPALSKITVPLLEIAPYDSAVDGKPPISLPSLAAKEQLYKGLLAAAPHATVAMIPDSRHFIMYDQPAQLNARLDAFMSSLP